MIKKKGTIFVKGQGVQSDLTKILVVINKKSAINFSDMTSILLTLQGNIVNFLLGPKIKKKKLKKYSQLLERKS